MRAQGVDLGVKVCNDYFLKFSRGDGPRGGRSPKESEGVPPGQPVADHVSQSPFARLIRCVMSTKPNTDHVLRPVERRAWVSARVPGIEPASGSQPEASAGTAYARRTRLSPSSGRLRADIRTGTADGPAIGAGRLRNDDQQAGQGTGYRQDRERWQDKKKAPALGRGLRACTLGVGRLVRTR